jgi:sugar-specific transcriptional regulator TrmB
MSMDIKKSLQQLGYGKNEAAVYEALLKLGLTQSGAVIKATKLHSVLVYNALEHLKSDGLISVVRKKNIQMFQAQDPSVLMNKVKESEEIVKKLIPELKKLQSQKVPAVSVKTLVGQEGLINNLKEITESAARSKQKYINSIGGARDVDFYDAIGDWYDNYLALTTKLKVGKRTLAPATYSAAFHEKFSKETNAQVKTLPEGLNTPAYTRITEEMVSIEVYKPEIIVIQIKNPIIAKGYLDSFELLWKMAKKQSALPATKKVEIQRGLK